MKKTIYIAGPMRGIPHFNHPAFFEAERMLLKDGEYEVVNPARMDKESEEEFEPRTALNRDLSAICERCTAIYMLKGWQKSAGAMSEYNLAKCLELELYYQEGSNEETPLKLDGYSEAILGLGNRFSNSFYIYDKEKIIDILMDRDGFTRENANDYFDNNIAGSEVGVIFMEDVYSDCEMKECCSMGDEHIVLCSSCFKLSKKSIEEYKSVSNESKEQIKELKKLKDNIETLMIRYPSETELSHLVSCTFFYSLRSPYVIAKRTIDILLLRWDTFDSPIKNIIVKTITEVMGSGLLTNVNCWFSLLEGALDDDNFDSPQYLTKEKLKEYRREFETDEEHTSKKSHKETYSYLFDEGYPRFCCEDCGKEALTLPENEGKKQFKVSTYTQEPITCEVCGEHKECTPVRDFQYPDFSNLNKNKEDKNE